MNTLFNTGFLFIRNQHILPRIKYGINANKANFWRLKKIITEKLNDINHIDNSSFEITLNQEDYFKLIYCESELFLNKSYIQYHDYKKMVDKLSGSWSFVTLYYLLFFNLCCLMRFCDCGYVYLSSEYTRKLENSHAALKSLPIKINDGNYFFKKISADNYGNIKISLKRVDTTHKVIWGEFRNILIQLIEKSSAEELVIYKTILSHLDSFQSSFPSSIRNELNYNAETSLLDLNSQITCYDLSDLDEYFFSSFLKIDRNKTDLSNKIKSITHISNFIYNLNFRLAEEFYERSGFGKDFIRMRNKIS